MGYCCAGGATHCFFLGVGELPVLDGHIEIPLKWPPGIWLAITLISK